VARALGGNPSAAISMFLLMLGVLLLTTFAMARLETNAGVLLGLGIVLSIMVFFNTSIAVYLLIFSMLLSPEFALTEMATSRASLGRGVTFRFDDFLLVIIGISWFVKGALYKELGVFQKTPLNTAMVFYIFACVLSTLIGVGAARVDPLTGSLFVLKYVQYFVLFFLIINNIEDERQLRRYWIAVVVTALIVGAVGVAQIPGGGRVTAPFEGNSAEPNTLGGYLSFLILIFFSLSLTLREYGARIAYMLVSLFLIVPFMFTLSRASYLGLVPGLAVVLFLSRNHRLSYCMVALALTFLIFPQVFPEIVRDRVSFTWSQAARTDQKVLFGQRMDTSTSARLGSFEDVLEDFPNEPLFGHGVTGWGFIDAQYFRILIETGLLGLVAFFYLILRLFQLGLDRRRYFSEDPFYRGLAIGFLGGLTALLIHGIGSNTFVIVRIMQPFWLIVGLLFMSRLVATKKSPEERDEPISEAA